jgi:anti-sigma factor RsiW
VTEIADQLSCQELVELVTEYLDDALTRADRARFEAHIVDCDGCTGYLEQIRLTIAVTGRVAPEQLTPEAEAALLEAFRDWKSRP